MTFRLGENLPVASDELTVGQVLHEVSTIKRRSGAVILVNEQGKLSRHFFRRRSAPARHRQRWLGPVAPIAQVMTPDPKRMPRDALASEAMAILRQFRIDELPVVDEHDRPLGLIDVQDLVVLKMLDVDPNS